MPLAILKTREDLMWNYKSTAGNFWIVSRQEKYLLGIEDEVLGEYQSLESAVKDVDLQATGCPRWDNLRKAEKSGGIANWDKE